MRCTALLCHPIMRPFKYGCLDVDKKKSGARCLYHRYGAVCSSGFDV